MAEIMLYYGEEPYRIMKKRESLKVAENPEMNLYITEVFDQEALEYAYQIPFLARKRVMIVDLEAEGDTGLLKEYLAAPAPDTNLYVFVREMDFGNTLAKIFPKQNVCRIGKFTPKELKLEIFYYTKKHGKYIREDACEELIERVQYLNEDKSFFDMENELKKLCSAAEREVDRELIQAMVPRNEKENVFSLMHLILNHKTEQLFHEAELILESGESNTIQVLSLLLRSYRIAMKASLLGKEMEKELGVHPKAVIHMPLNVSEASMDCIQEIIFGIKNGRYKEKDGLILCLSHLADYAKKTVC